MKKILLLIITAFLISCEDVVNVDLKNDSPRLVIEANMERIFNETDEFYDFVEVNLSLTTPFFSEEEKFVNNAVVTVTNLKNSEVFSVDNINDKGQYFLRNFLFSIDPEAEYKLSIVYNNETYESIEKLNLSAPFTCIKQVENKNAFDEDQIAVEVAFLDRVNEENFYFIDYGDSNLGTTDDDFFDDGKPIKVTTFFDDNVTLKNHVFTVIGSDQRLNNFVEAVLELSGEDTAGPFGTTPFKAKGNIANITNSENFPFGYFRVSEIYTTAVDLVPNSEFIPPVTIEGEEDQNCLN